MAARQALASLCLSGCFSNPLAVVSRMARPSFPKTLREFQAKFGSEEACQEYLASCRWPEGFAVCGAGTGAPINWRDKDTGNVPPVGARFR